MRSLDLHSLANMPGSGRAQQELRAAGHWDEDAGQPEREFTVYYSQSISGSITVKARSENAARNAAVEAIRDGRGIVMSDGDIELTTVLDSSSEFSHSDARTI